MKALVVDDSTVMRKVIAGACMRANIKDIAQAADGELAVAACEAEDFDLILMDWNMPNMSGLDALKAIREAGKTMPIIMVTTETEKGRIVEALKAGATNYVIKPFEPGVIVGKIKAAVR